MHEIYKLKEMLCDELKTYGGKSDLSAGTLEIVDKLAHAVKNLDRILDDYETEDGYSSHSYDGGMPAGRYSREGSWARGRRNARRDSLGRYSSAGDMAERLRRLKDEAPDERTRETLARLADELERM